MNEQSFFEPLLIYEREMFAKARIALQESENDVLTKTPK